MSYHFSSREFFQKCTGCHAVATKSLFSRQKMENRYLFWERSFEEFESKFLEIFKIRFWLSRSDDEKRYFQKLGFSSSPWLLPRVLFTRESVLNDEHLEIFFLLQSPFDVCILPTFWDLYCNSHVWLEQSTKIWAIVGKTTILAIAVPFWWGMTLKHRKSPFRARIESIKSSGKRS